MSDRWIVFSSGLSLFLLGSSHDRELEPCRNRGSKVCTLKPSQALQKRDTYDKQEHNSQLTAILLEIHLGSNEQMIKPKFSTIHTIDTFFDDKSMEKLKPVKHSGLKTTKGIRLN